MNFLRIDMMNLIQSAGRLIRKPIVAGLVVLVLLTVVAAGLFTPKAPAQVSSAFEVKRGDFLISVVEGGTIEAVNEVVVRSEVEGIARIIYIVPEGYLAKKGDLLVELDSSQTQDAVNLQQIAVERAQFTVIQAEQQLDIGKSMVDSEVKAATLKLEFAQSDLEKYVKGEALQAQRNANIEITNALEVLQMAEERLKWTEELYAKGFETKGNLDKDRLAVSQGRSKLEQTKQALWMLQTYDQPKRRRELEAAAQEAKENLERVRLQGERRVAQLEADVTAQKSTLDLSRKKLERDMRQLAATKIYAPQDGLVVYAGSGNRFSSESMIEEGAVVRNRQELIKLPDVSAMKLQVKIHESHINQVQPGQPAIVVLDSAPDQRYRGVVNRVAPLPDSSSRWSNPNLKVYATEIVVTDRMPEVKPGVSARAEIIVTNLPNVITVPLQAVTTRKGQQVVFLASAPDKAVPVDVGMYNTKYIEVLSGLREGDRVLLAPPSDTEEQDLSGAILASGEAIPVADSNATAKALSRVIPTVKHMETPGTKKRKSEEPAKTLETPVGLASKGAKNRDELLKRFDKNKDGQLDQQERNTMQQTTGKGQGGVAAVN